jgi:hypothetical protein
MSGETETTGKTGRRNRMLSRAGVPLPGVMAPDPEII